MGLGERLFLYCERGRSETSSPSRSTPRAMRLFALNRFLGVPPGWAVLTLIGFAAIVFLTMQLKCWSGGIGFRVPRSPARPSA